MRTFFFVFLLCALSCSSSAFETGETNTPNLPDAQPLPAPDVFAQGWPGAVPCTTPYIACDFSVPCDTGSGQARILLREGGEVSAQGVWCDENRRLMLYPDQLPIGGAELKLSGYRSADGRAISDLEAGFHVARSEEANDRTAPAVLAQLPRDQDFSVSPSLHRITIRFTKAIDLAAVEYSFTDGSREIPVSLNQSVRFSDLFVLTLQENLKAENCYILILTRIQDEYANMLPIHVLLFATGAADSAQDSRVGLVEHLVISEICHGGYKGGSAADEFIELYNPGFECIDLAQGGYRLYRATAGGKAELLCDFSKDAHFAASTPSSSFLIPPHGFFLISTENAGQEMRSLADALILKSRATLTANNSVWLTKNGTPEQAEKTLDLIGYGAASQYEGTTAAPDPGSGKSLERKARIDSTAESMLAGEKDARKGNALDRDQNGSDVYIRALPEPQGRRSSYEDWTF